MKRSKFSAQKPYLELGFHESMIASHYDSDNRERLESASLPRESFISSSALGCSYGVNLTPVALNWCSLEIVDEA